ncbi:MAG: hypothetical protein K2L76_03105, partial [Muribaculaceae bacterium]|nr:hypothetical protein [Muribaculaceae bacterium]
MTDMTDFRYHLARRESVCPACGRRRFKLYMDAADRPLHSSCGRCNRENNCGYHLTPRQFLASHPECGDASPLPPTLPPTPCDTMPMAWVDRSYAYCRGGNRLRSWLRTRFDPDTVDRVLLCYATGGSRVMEGSMVFWQIDSHMRVRSGKIMAFDADGRRVRPADGEPPATRYVHTLPGAVRRGYRYAGCFFGAHLTAALPPEATRIVVVESEKTALYLALHLQRRGLFPARVLPVATGGSSGICFSLDRMADPDYRWRDLAGRPLVLIPDADATAKWRAAAVQLRRVCPSVVVVDISSRAASPSDDILDILEARRAAAARPRRDASRMP